jgi:glucose/mannose-6-phosphate isomerase
MGAVATRLRQQLNENAKMLGHSATVPELNHNEIVGWEVPGDAWRDTAVLVLRDHEDRPEVARRLELTGEYAARQGAEVHVIPSPDGRRLARMAAQTQFADYLSLYLAVARGVDPTPIASIDEFKRRLAESAAAREG